MKREYFIAFRIIKILKMIFRLFKRNKRPFKTTFKSNDKSQHTKENR
ncbi:hypothetical protein [Helicobacter sp. 12S02232-10]|nr:hypothetical protein [Helicobacter sp. 12S02232-10]